MKVARMAGPFELTRSGFKPLRRVLSPDSPTGCSAKNAITADACAPGGAAPSGATRARGCETASRLFGDALDRVERGAARGRFRTPDQFQELHARARVLAKDAEHG